MPLHLNLGRARARTQSGFSLIELMIVIVIMGVLAAAAIPSYNTYMIRSRMSDGLGILSSLKSKLTEYHTLNNTFPPLTTSSDPIGLTGVTSPFVTSVAITSTGGNYATMTATMDPVKLGLGAGSTANMGLVLEVIAPGQQGSIILNTSTSYMDVCYAYCAASNLQYFPASCKIVASPPAS